MVEGEPSELLGSVVHIARQTLDNDSNKDQSATGESDDSSQDSSRPTSAPPTLDFSNQNLFSFPPEMDPEQSLPPRTTSFGLDKATIDRGDAMNSPSNSQSISSSNNQMQLPSDSTNPLGSNEPKTQQKPIGAPTNPPNSPTSGDSVNISSNYADFYETSIMQPLPQLQNKTELRKRTQSIEKFLSQSPSHALGRKRLPGKDKNDEEIDSPVISANDDDAMQYINVQSPGQTLNLRKQLSAMNVSNEKSNSIHNNTASGASNHNPSMDHSLLPENGKASSSMLSSPHGQSFQNPHLQSTSYHGTTSNAAPNDLPGLTNAFDDFAISSTSRMYGTSANQVRARSTSPATTDAFNGSLTSPVLDNGTTERFMRSELSQSHESPLMAAGSSHQLGGRSIISPRSAIGSNDGDLSRSTSRTPPPSVMNSMNGYGNAVIQGDSNSNQLSSSFEQKRPSYQFQPMMVQMPMNQGNQSSSNSQMASQQYFNATPAEAMSNNGQTAVHSNGQQQMTMLPNGMQAMVVNMPMLPQGITWAMPNVQPNMIPMIVQGVPQQQNQSGRGHDQSNREPMMHRQMQYDPMAHQQDHMMDYSQYYQNQPASLNQTNKRGNKRSGHVHQKQNRGQNGRDSYNREMQQSFGNDDMAINQGFPNMPVQNGMRKSNRRNDNVDATYNGGNRDGVNRKPQNNANASHGPGAVIPPDTPLEKCEGHVFQLSQEQNGCRFLQQKVDADGPIACTTILEEVRERLVQLMMDPFGNYLFQKLLEHARKEQRSEMLQTVKAHLVHAALNLHGTRSVQKFIEVCGKDNDTEDMNVLIDSLSPFVTKLSMDTNGNHVVQRCLQYMPGETAQFVYDTVVRDVLVITRHRHGCCVFQRCIDAANKEQHESLVQQVITHAIQLMQDPFGNYVVQYVLERARPRETKALINQLLGGLAHLSMQKFSSNVVEKCLQAATPEMLEPMIRELAEPNTMRNMLHDQFANYVVQRALLVANDEQGMQLVASIRPHLAGLGSFNPSCARRVATRVVKRFPKVASDPAFTDFLQNIEQI